MLTKGLWLIGIVGFLASLGLSASRYGQPSTEFWIKRGDLLLVCVLASALAPLAQSGFVEYGERQRRKRLEREANVREILTGVLVDLVRTANSVDCTKAGLSAFLVRRPFPWHQQVQQRLSRVKLAFNPPPSGITWTRGKGLIGRCWATGKHQVVNLEDQFAPLLGATAEEWVTFGADKTFGLTSKEFQRTKGYYGRVGAVPIVSASGRYMGCVSFDLPPGMRAPDLHDDVLVEKLRGGARMIELLLTKS